MEYLTTECQLVITHIISRTNEYNLHREYDEQIALTIKRIQKILYLSQIEHIKQTGKSMFEDEFYAWPIGPAIPAVYHMYLDYTTKSDFVIKKPEGTLSKEKIQIIDYILESTNNINTNDLVKYGRYLDNLWESFYNQYDKNHSQVIKKSILLSYYQTNKNNNALTKVRKKQTR